MRLIVGGAHQGKTRYASEKYGGCIDGFHLLIRDWLANGLDPLAEAERFLAENPDAVIVMDEIGCGIIPMEKSDRLWREAVGRTGCYLAERAETVERVVCGIPVKIKG